MNAPLAEWSEFDPVYDLPECTAPPRTYLIATTQRTGSHYLAHLLARDGGLGVPFEYLNDHRQLLEIASRGWTYGEDSKIRVLQDMRRRRTGTSGWFGIKAHWHTWANVQTRPRIARLVEPERVIYLSREDRMSQAVSLSIAESSGDWVNVGDRPRRTTPVDGEHVADALRRIQAECEAWEGFLSRWPRALHLRYEDLVTDPEGVVDRVFDYFDVPRSPSLRTLPPMRATSDASGPAPTSAKGRP